ncbi:MAG: hypothetical protein LBH00_04920 [Planctomycetaceae bacterium]|jgi:phenylalanyl-tRNA synthetase beta chain|nr:hypothetical protein [Planctomycetaceae bacterium]
MSTLRVGIPPFRSRKDISIPEDIVEEVLRVYGYDNIPPVMPSVPVKPMHFEKNLKLEHKIGKVLTAGHRFLEVHQYIWFHDNWLKTLDFDPGETLVLKNPTSPETSKLRTTLIPNLLALIPKNRPFRESFRLFETGRTFFSLQKNQECLEKHHLGGIAFRRSGSAEDCYLSVKSAVEDVLTILGIRGVSFNEPAAPGAYPWTTPGHFVTINAGQQIGMLGLLDKNMMNKVCKEGGQTVWFEIDLSRITGELYPAVSFEEPPRYPLSWQDFSLLWNTDDGFEKLESLLDRFSHPLVIRREFLVSYCGKGLEQGTAGKRAACYSFRFWIGSPDHTLSGEEIDAFHHQFLTFITASGVSLRS